MTSCAGLSAHAPAAQSPLARCASLRTEYEAWGAVAIAAGALGTTSGAAAFALDPTTERRIAAGTSILSAVAGGVSAWLRDQVSADYANECEAATSGSTTTITTVRTSSVARPK